MIKLIGSVVILVSCWICGKHLSKKTDLTLHVAEALVSFVAYTENSIKTLRIPLNEIYSSFKSPILENVGFIYALNNQGLYYAIKKVEHIVSPEMFNLLSFMEKHLGGINVENQCNLCKSIEESLKNEVQKAKKKHSEKKRMYQMLPILCGLSLIILII